MNKIKKHSFDQSYFGFIQIHQRELAESVKSEIMNYQKSLEDGRTPDDFKTNTDLAKNYGDLVYGASVSKKCISNILARYLSKNLCRFRERELKYKSRLLICFKSKEENSENGRNGAIKTNNIKRYKKNLLSKI